MAEQAAPPPTASPSSTPEDAAVAQARRRKERREAKIRAGASSRLNKISGLGGGLQREDPAPAKPAATEHADPDEVDISDHFYQPATTQRIPGGSDADAQRRQLQQMQQLLGAQPGSDGLPGGAAGANPFLDGGLFGPGLGAGAGIDGSGAAGADDPMAAMLNQMMQSMGGMGGGGGGPGGPGAAGAAFPGGPFPGFPGFPGAAGAAAAAPRSTTAANLWRVVHAAVALALGLYVALATPFAGTRAERELQQQRAAAGAGAGFDADAGADADAAFALHRRYFFYAFASAETVLLTTRYLLDGGLRGGSTDSGGGAGSLVGMAMGFLPPGVRRSLQLAQRYWQIFSTVRSDLLACVFVLGVCSWLRA